jgi:hypothetical protein
MCQQLEEVQKVDKFLKVVHLLYHHLQAVVRK